MESHDITREPLESVVGLGMDMARTIMAIGAVVLFVYVHAMFWPDRDHEAAMDRAPTFGL